MALLINVQVMITGGYTLVKSIPYVYKGIPIEFTIGKF